MRKREAFSSLALNTQPLLNHSTTCKPLYSENNRSHMTSVGVQGTTRSMKDRFLLLLCYFLSAYVSVRVAQVPKRGRNLFLLDS